MSYQEKETIVSLFSNIIISAIYFYIVVQRFQIGTYDSTGVIYFWASVILILIPVLIVPKIVIIIIFNIINTIITREEDDPSFTDELDKLIDLKATRNFYHVFMVGFLLSMVSIVAGMSVVVMFMILLSTLIISGIIMDISQLYFYRRGI